MSRSQACYRSLLAATGVIQELIFLSYTSETQNHTSTFLSYSQNPSKVIDLVYLKRYATGRVEKEMDDLDLSRRVSSDAFSCPPHG